MNFASLLDLQVRSRPDEVAIHDRETIYTWREVGHAVDALTYRLARDPQHGVALILPNSLEFVVSFFATLKAGRFAIPLNLRWQPSDMASALRDTGTRTILTSSVYAEQVRALLGSGLVDLVVMMDDRPPGSVTRIEDPRIIARSDLRPAEDRILAVPRQHADLADVIFTAGTSSRAKGVLHHHAYHFAHALARGEFFGIAQTDVGLVLSPMFHVGGQAVMTLAIANGTSLVTMSKWDLPAFLAAIERHRVTYMHLVSTVLLDIVNADPAVFVGRDTSSLRVTFVGGGPLTPPQLEEFERRVGGIVCEGYGRSEGGLAYNPPDRSRRKLGSHGLPIRSVAEMRIVPPAGSEDLPAGEVGEILVRGDGVSPGYWGRAELIEAAFLPEGWMRTGDLGRLDEDGFLYFEGRVDHMIKTGGENVYPAQVEEVLLAMPDIAEAAVVGIPDPRWGSLVAAAIVPARPNVRDEDVDVWCRQRLAGFQRPRAILILAELPKLASTKLDYAAIRDLLTRNSRRVAS